MRLLGIDYGEKRVGLALSDDTKTIATPLVVVPNDKLLLGFIARLAQEHEVEAMVIGASHNYQGKENPVMRSIQSFAEKAHGTLGLPIHFESEMLTSVQAARHETDRSLRDASAAALILQSYLDRKR
jgi:putative Holliday junction resolvase